jgi:Histidine kinase-like ATPase domain
MIFCRSTLQMSCSSATMLEGTVSPRAAGLIGQRMTAHPLPLAESAARIGYGWLTQAVEMAATASGNWPLGLHRPTPGVRCFPRVATRTLGMNARAAHAAREFTIATLRRWAVTERCDDIAIVVSELLTNALRHALPVCGESGPCWPIRLGLLQPGPSIMCAVADPSEEIPVLKDPGTFAETGRGLHVIGALADRWGYTTPTGTGKIVWAMFSIDPGEIGH